MSFIYSEHIIFVCC